MAGVVLMRVWRVHEVGEPEDVFVLEDVDEPTAAGLAGMGMSMGGWVPREEAPYKVTPEFAILDMRAGCTSRSRRDDGTRHVRPRTAPVHLGPGRRRDRTGGVARPRAPGRGAGVVGVCIQPWGSLADVAVGSLRALRPHPLHSTTSRRPLFLIPGAHRVRRSDSTRAVRGGETVLVTGAAGGLGSACVQLAASRGAPAIAAVGNAEKARHCAALGAADIVDHSMIDVVAGLRELVGDRGLDVIIDPVQGPDRRDCERCCSPTAGMCSVVTPAASS